jgi:hypothetical protein
MSLIAPMRAVVVGGSVLECLAFTGFGADTLLLGMALNERGYGVANDLNFLAAAVQLALAAGFASGAFLMSSRWVDEKIAGGRTMGGVLHLGATVVAAWGAIWLGLSEVRVDPNTGGYWSPWIAFALAAVVIVIGLAVLMSLFPPARQARRTS